MRKKCLKCGYEQQSSDVAPDYECPKCGAIYAKVEAHLTKRQQISRTPKIQEGNKQTKQCSYCGETILHIAIKCKHCGSKLDDNSSVQEPNRLQDKKRYSQSKELSINKIAIVIGIGILCIVFVAFGSFDKFWAHLISPFDSKPKISFTNLVKNPEKIQEYEEELCAWLKREELRNPSIYTTTARESVCKDIK